MAILDYQQLQASNYTGDAYNVYYEFGSGDEWWGHNGEYADELDAWFYTQEEAVAFADSAFGDDVMAEKLASSPDAGGADSVMLCIKQWGWENGVAEWDGDELFARYDKQHDGSIVRGDGNLR